jgi:hypothetical protein
MDEGRTHGFALSFHAAASGARPAMTHAATETQRAGFVVRWPTFSARCSPDAAAVSLPPCARGAGTKLLAAPFSPP